MPTVVVGRRGQITIPSRIRQELKLQEGVRVAVIVRDGEVVLRPAPRSILELGGSIQVSGPQDFEAIRAKALEEVAKGVAAGGD